MARATKNPISGGLLGSQPQLSRGDEADSFNTLLVGGIRPIHSVEQPQVPIVELVAVYFHEPFIQPCAFPHAHVPVKRQDIDSGPQDRLDNIGLFIVDKTVARRTHGE